MGTAQRSRKSEAKGRHGSKPQRNKVLLPEAKVDDDESLKASIQLHGVILPVIRNSDGTIIDGARKSKICEELGIKQFPTEVLHVDSQTAEQIRLELNLCRTGSLHSRRVLAQLRLIEDPEQSDHAIARLTKSSHRTVAAIREALVVRGQIAQVKIRKGIDGKTYKKFPKVRTKTKKEAEKVAALLRELGDDAPKRELDLRALKRLLRETEKNRKKAQPPVPSGEIKIEHSDFRKLNLGPASVDMIFTDPLYGKKYLPQYSELAKFAATVLKPGCILMAYAPQLYLNEVIRRLDEHLEFLWPCALINDACSQPNFQRGFFSGYRPVLVYTKGKSKWFGKGRVEKPDDYVRDTFKRGPKEKSLYIYQQPVDEAIYYIGKLTKPQDLIVDCFGGSFTTAQAVYRLGGRRFIGCDIDDKCVAMGRERLAKLMDSCFEEGSPEECKGIAAEQITKRIAEHQDVINHLHTQLEELNTLNREGH